MPINVVTLTQHLVKDGFADNSPGIMSALYNLKEAPFDQKQLFFDQLVMAVTKDQEQITGIFHTSHKNNLDKVQEYMKEYQAQHLNQSAETFKNYEINSSPIAAPPQQPYQQPIRTNLVRVAARLAPTDAEISDMQQKAALPSTKGLSPEMAENVTTLAIVKGSIQQLGALIKRIEGISEEIKNTAGSIDKLQEQQNSWVHKIKSCFDPSREEKRLSEISRLESNVLASVNQLQAEVVKISPITRRIASLETDPNAFQTQWEAKNDFLRGVKIELGKIAFKDGYLGGEQGKVQNACEEFFKAGNKSAEQKSDLIKIITDNVATITKSDISVQGACDNGIKAIDNKIAAVKSSSSVDVDAEQSYSPKGYRS